MLLTMENKNIEFSVDPREYQMALIMNLPNNTPKAAMEVIREIQKERDFLLEIKRHRDLLLEENKKSKEENEIFIKDLLRQNEQLKDTIDRDSGCEENARLRKENEKLKENQLTEENAMDYIYQHSDQYEDWIEESDLYISIWKEHKELKEEHEKLKLLAQPLFRAILNHENN